MASTLTRVRRVLTAAAAAAACIVIATATLPAQAPVLIKMATLVPDGSSWHLVLKEVAAQWGKVSAGRVKVNLYAGGSAGDDPGVVLKMNLGTLNAAVLSSVGVAEIDKSVYALSLPMAYNDDEEVYYVLGKMRPRLEANMLARGFVVLNWADGGWVQFFAQKPVATPDDLRKLKLFSWAGDPKSTEIWQSAGFNPVALPSTELATSLQTGLTQAFSAPPQVAALTNYYANANNMTDMRWALMLGATVIKKDAWARIPAELQPQLLKIAQDAGAKLQDAIRKSRDADVAAMKTKGLNVVTVDAATFEMWRKTAESLYPKIRGVLVPADAFDDALRYRDEYRTQQAAAKK